MGIRVKKNGKWINIATGQTVDPSLSIEGQAADAKAVGDRIDDLENWIGSRHTTSMDFSEWHNGVFYETVEGMSERIKYTVEFDTEGRPIKINQGTRSTEVIWWQT